MSDGGKKWLFRWNGHVLREQDITVSQAERVEDITGTSWLFINPLRSAKHGLAIISVMGADASGRPQAEVSAEVGSMSVESFMDALDYEDDNTPEMYEDGNPQPGVATSTD